MNRLYYQQVSLSKIRYFYMEHFGKNPLLSRVHPDLKKAQRKVVHHIRYNASIQKV